MRVGAEYVVFHVVPVDDEEGFTYQGKHTDREVIDAAADFINELLDGQEYSLCVPDGKSLQWSGSDLFGAGGHPGID